MNSSKLSALLSVIVAILFAVSIAPYVTQNAFVALNVVSDRHRLIVINSGSGGSMAVDLILLVVALCVLFVMAKNLHLALVQVE